MDGRADQRDKPITVTEGRRTMRGSIVKRDSGYSIVYDVGEKWDEKKGCYVRAQKWEKVPHPDTRKHAEMLLAERLAQLHKGEFIEPSKITFAAFADKWFEKYARVQVRPSTLVLYEVELTRFFGQL
jgi:hypothetical protein